MKNENKKAIIITLVFITVTILLFQIDGTVYLSDTVYYEYDISSQEYGEPMECKIEFYQRINVTHLKIDADYISTQCCINGEIYNAKGYRMVNSDYVFEPDTPSEYYYLSHFFDEDKNMNFIIFSDDFEEVCIRFCNRNYELNYEIKGKLKHDE